jgi:hypothetical protein
MRRKSFRALILALSALALATGPGAGAEANPPPEYCPDPNVPEDCRPGGPVCAGGEC